MSDPTTVEWDARKAAAHLRKHGVSFDDAATAFSDPLSITVSDPDHSDDELRFVLIGRALSGRLVVVVHAERGENIRIISARAATLREVRSHEQADR